MDTAGQERYNSLSENYYKQADCCLLVYDITSRDSFNRIENYFVPKIKENCNQILKVVLLGNKADLKDKRKVSDKEGANLALENEYTFMESSCVDNYNVLDAFTALIDMTNNEFKKNNDIRSIKAKKISLSDDETIKEKKKCC